MSTRGAPLDDDGNALEDDSAEVFCNLPKPPAGWDDSETKLDFKMSRKEQDFLRRKLSLLTRPAETAQALLARLAEARNSFPISAPVLPRGLDASADDADKRALGIARDAADLVAIGRRPSTEPLSNICEPRTVVRKKRRSVCNFIHISRSMGKLRPTAVTAGLETLLPSIPDYVSEQRSPEDMQNFVRSAKPEAYFSLRDCYQRSEK